MLEAIVATDNLNRAYKKVMENGGAGGVDGMDTAHLLPYLLANGEALRRAILEGRYRPNPARGADIPKDDGGVRRLEIPTVVDRMVQRAIAQTLTPVYEPQFSEASYGYRPGRSALDAVRRCLGYLREGYVWVVDMDLDNFFDTVDQDKLMDILARDIDDRRVLSLIGRCLRAGTLRQGRFEETEAGVPQGSPLSPLLANVMLNKLDHELERRGHRFLRYADDLVILCRTRAEAEQALKDVAPFIDGELALKINRTKTAVVHATDMRFLGYAFREDPAGFQPHAHESSIARMKAKLQAILDACAEAGNMTALRLYVAGWVNYYKLSDMKRLLTEDCPWMNGYVRSLFWRAWYTCKLRDEARRGTTPPGIWARAAAVLRGLWAAEDKLPFKNRSPLRHLRRALPAAALLAGVLLLVACAQDANLRYLLIGVGSNALFASLKDALRGTPAAAAERPRPRPTRRATLPFI